MEETPGMKVNSRFGICYTLVLLACSCPHLRVPIPAGSWVVCVEWSDYPVLLTVSVARGME
jgi:hypothetical protein